MAELETAQLKGIMVGQAKAENKLMPIIEQQNKKLEQKEREFITIVKNMKKKGYSNQIIADITNRNIIEIKNL